MVSLQRQTVEHHGVVIQTGIVTQRRVQTLQGKRTFNIGYNVSIIY